MFTTNKEMSLLIYAKEDDKTKQIDLEDLFTKEQKRSQKMLSTFNKILNRIHKRIELTARQKVSDKHVFFLVPEFLLGEPNYNLAECIAYMVTKLESNDFLVRYIHPNTLYVSWHHFVPLFVRDQVKQKTGMAIDTHGQLIVEAQEEKTTEGGNETPKAKKQYKPTDRYRPTGQFVYGSDLFENMERRLESK
jgi:hypothetical protein